MQIVDESGRPALAGPYIEDCSKRRRTCQAGAGVRFRRSLCENARSAAPPFRRAGDLSFRETINHQRGETVRDLLPSSTMTPYTLTEVQRATYRRYASLALPRHTSYPVV